MSQVSSPEVVQEAISLGTWSYVVKTKAERDLLAAIDAALQGRQFVSILDSGWAELTVRNMKHISKTCKSASPK